MELNVEKKTIERAVLVGLNADCFTAAQTATETGHFNHFF